MRALVGHYLAINLRKGDDYGAAGKLLNESETIKRNVVTALPSELARLKKRGVPNALDLVERYRVWRLTMETETKLRQRPYDLMIC